MKTPSPGAVARFGFLCCYLLVSPITAHAGSATWKPHPTSGDWNSAANWRPRTIPNGPSDTATFGVSDATDVLLPRRQMEVDGIVFSPAARSFTISVNYSGVLVLSGIGITNNSGVDQNFAVSQSDSDNLMFTNQATAGIQTVFTAGPDKGYISFYDQATADFATFVIVGTEYFVDGSAGLLFYNNSTAANAVVTNTGGSGEDSQGGSTAFYDNSTAANGKFTNKASTDAAAYGGGVLYFADASTAANALITNEGAASIYTYGGFTDFFGSSATAGNATIICNGGEGPFYGFGEMLFHVTSSAGNATLIANGGSDGGDGGLIQFSETADGGTARVELFGNGTLDTNGVTNLAGVSIGSLEGDGIVLLGTSPLTIGSNDLSTAFAGVIEGSGAVTKVGSGTLTLTGANTYTGGTTVSEGFLKVANRSGSATGTGVAQVDGGTLGGGGIISGAVTVGSGSGPGAFLAPGTGSTTLTLQNTLSFAADGSYTYRIRTTSAKADKVIANGVTIESGAQFDAIAIGNVKLPTGTSFTAISNTAGTSIAGAFENLPDGATISVGRNTFQANYEGGDGNDLTLTVVP